MSSERRIDVWVPPENARDLFGSITNSTVTFESGGAIWVPAQPEHHMLRGLKYVASGTPQQLQQLSVKIISQCLAGSKHLDVTPEGKQWLYLNDQDTLFGPFSGAQLHKWHSSGMWTPDFAICHESSGIWLPVWLVLQLTGLSAAATIARSATGAPATSAHAGAAEDCRPNSSSATMQAGQLTDSSKLKADSDTTTTGDGEYGSLSHTPQSQQHRQKHLVRQLHGPLVHAAGSHASQHCYGIADGDGEYGYSYSAVTQQARQAAAGGTSNGCNQHPVHSPAASTAAPRASRRTADAGYYATDEGYNDAEMLDWNAEVMAELLRLRQDSAFLQELTNAVDMDWEPQGQCLQQLPPTGLAAGNSGWLLQQPGLAGGNGSTGLLVLVVDTNVLLDSRGLMLLQHLQEVQQQPQQQQQVLVMIPWTVLVELDKLKARHSGAPDGVSVASKARAALRHLHVAMAPDSSWRHMYKAQSIEEFRSAAHDFNLGISERLVVADDRILQCALSCQQLLQQLQRQQELSALGCGVLLLTNDMAFRLKAQANSVHVASLRELPVASGSQQHHHHQQLMSSLQHLAGMTASVVASGNSNSMRPPRSVPTPAPLPAVAEVQQQPVDTAAKSLALSHITSLRLVLSSHVTAIFKSEYEDLWLDVVSSKPPWRDSEFLHLLHKHWRSTLQDHLQPSARHHKKQLEVAVEYLLDINKQLHRRGSNSSSNSVQPEQLQQNVAVRVIQLLEAFGVTAAAADVAAAAGLDLAGAFLGGALCTHGHNTHKVQTQTADPLGRSQASQLMGLGQSQHLAGGVDPELTETAAQHVQSVEGRTEQHGVSSGRAGTHEQQGVDDGGGGRHHLHAVRHSLAHAAAVAQAMPANYGSAVGGGPGQQQQMGVGSVQQAQQQWLQQGSGMMGFVQALQPQQHMHHVQQQPRGAPWLAAACAGVPVPQLQGPCFRLQQLVEYAVALLHAVVPALHQLQQSDPTAAAEASSAVRQGLQHVVKLVDLVMRNCNSLLQQQQSLETIQGVLYATLLQLGLQLIQLCCGLLADSAACSSVAGQLTAHAPAFVADGLEYIMVVQQQQGAYGATVPGIYHLRAALEQL